VTHTDTGSQLLAAIVANPDEDTPRLVYADWLDENGLADRAEFIRVACRIIRLRPEAKRTNRTSAERVELAALEMRASDLLNTSIVEWLPLSGWVICPEWEPAGNMYPDQRWAFIGRGFIESVTCTAADFLAHADVLLWHPKQGRPSPGTAHPIRRVTLTTAPDEFEQLTIGSITGDHDYYRVAGRVVKVPQAATVKEILEARWKGVAFTVPDPDPIAEVNLGPTQMLTLPAGTHAATPVYVVCGSGYLPEDGWSVNSITVHEDTDDATWRAISDVRPVRPWSPRHTSNVPVQFTISLPVRASPPVRPTSADCGTEFGPIDGRDGYGNSWRCRAILRDVRILDPERSSLLAHQYEAESVGEVERVIRTGDADGGAGPQGGIPV
jgi:uncharacterized protein (TIGR02996 family)